MNGRIECDFESPADSPTPYEEYVLSKDYEFRTSTLQYDQATDEFSFHIKTRKIDNDGDAVEIEGSDDTGHQTVLGIDLGVNSLVVATTGTFWSGDEYDHWIHEFERRRAEMQQRAGHRPLTTPYFDLESVRKRGGSSTSTRSPTKSLPKRLHTTATLSCSES